MEKDFLKDIEVDFLKDMEDNSFYLDVSSYGDREKNAIMKFIKNLESNNPFNKIEFLYDGNPSPAPRPRTKTIYTEDGPRTQWYDPGSKDKNKIKKYVKSIVSEDYDPCRGEVYAYIECYKPFLAGFSKLQAYLAEKKILRPAKKPDVDNYAKTVLDAVNGVLFYDDGQIVKLVIEKYYSIFPRIYTKLYYRENQLYK
jgi:Holliday junction resolvase RusA-like endonuclease